MEVKTPANPSRKATARVKNPLPVPCSCRFCSGHVRVGTHEEVYGRDYGDWPYVYLCESCRAYVGMHPFTSIPLGTLADQRTRDARKKCKPAFERLWKSGRMTRSEAYEWLAGKLGIPVGECHFGWFTPEQCEEAERICNQ
ncbi:zinc-finger-containing protein [Enterobacter kobei]|uniref:zinc-finger-containing protein n=1 Tax=Enterobacter kobei TaxID=208224 RepID=UPI000938E9A5|nr:zinc-finger-containing protein [Enterobacter kobei]